MIITISARETISAARSSSGTASPNQIEGRVAGLAVDEFDQNLPLGTGQLFQLLRKFFLNKLLNFLGIFFLISTFLGGGNPAIEFYQKFFLQIGIWVGLQGFSPQNLIAKFRSLLRKNFRRS